MSAHVWFREWTIDEGQRDEDGSPRRDVREGDGGKEFSACMENIGLSDMFGRNGI